MRKIALITDGWKRLFTYAWSSGILQRIRETGEDVNLYIFNSTGNWNRDEGYNRAEYNIYNLPDLRQFDGIILELNNISSQQVLADIIGKARKSGLPVVSIANELADDFYYVGIDNRAAMRRIIAHLHDTHGARSFWLLMGPQNNYESDRRLQGMLEWAQENGIAIATDEITHSGFDYRSGERAFSELWKRHGKLPDAVVCVNDNVAVAVCEAAARLGYHAPDDFLVTGFDNFDKACFYTPSITTVSHIREEAAALATDVLLRVWEGQHPQRFHYTQTTLICQQSCGCPEENHRDARAHLKEQIIYGVDSEEFDSEVLELESAMMQCSTVEEMMYCIPQGIPSMKCDAMYLVMDDRISDYKKEVDDDLRMDASAQGDEGLLLRGYPKRMRVAFAYENGCRIEPKRKEIRGLFPMFDSEESGQDFLFLPLHFGERAVGYVVIRNAVYLMEKQYLFQIMNALTRSMENLHHKEKLAYMNRRLSSLYLSDQLTGLYNRQGYQQLGEHLYRNTKRDGKRLLILFADLDRLKFINDTYGHLHGDHAIQAAARALTSHVSENAVAARTGGDEFVLLDLWESDEQEQAVKDAIESALTREGKAFPFALGMSIGTVVTDPGSAETFEEYVKLADAAMYREKVRRHAERRQ